MLGSSTFAGDDDRVCVRILATQSARGLHEACPPTEGAGNAGCLLHPRSRVQKCVKKRTRAYRYSRGTPAFPAQWFDGLCRALPGAEFLWPPSLPACWLIDPVGSNSPPAAWHQPRVSGPHGFAVRFSAVRPARAVHSRLDAALRTIFAPTLPRPPHPVPRS
jgi:hypothetical protein